MKKAMNTTWVRKNVPLLLTIASGIGVLATAVLAVRGAKEHERREEEAKAKPAPKETPTREEQVKEWVEVDLLPYAPAAACGALTLTCVFGANFLNKRQQATLASAYGVLDRTYQTYRKKVRGIAGAKEDRFFNKAAKEEKKDEDNGEPPWDEMQTFYVAAYGKLFDCTLQDIQRAEYDINRKFAYEGYATLNEFLDFLHLPKLKDGDDIGWTIDCSDNPYGYCWIDFRHERQVTDDGTEVCEICFDAAPKAIVYDEAPQDE